MSLSLEKIRKTAQKYIQELVAPTRCLFCGSYGERFCSDCVFILEKLPSECPVCRKPSYDYLPHLSCRNNTYLDQLIACYKYNDVAKKIIEAFKFQFDKDVSKIIGDQIIKNNSITALFEEDIILVPVPLFSKREKWRGFNQSELIVDEILKNYISLKKMNLLKRVKETTQQAKLNRDKRLKNVDNAFELDSEIANKISKDTTIILVDDITTTTSTLNECAKVLKMNRFSDVRGIVFARGE